jgi:hypothetical protein
MRVRKLAVSSARWLAKNLDYTHDRFSECNPGEFVARKLGSNLGPFTAEYRVKPWSGTQNQAKRINNIGYWLLLRDQRNQSVSIFVSAIYIARLGPLGSNHQRPSSAKERSISVMASLEKSLNSLRTGGGAEPLFMLRCDRSPVMLTWLHHLASLGNSLRSTISGCNEALRCL